MLKQVATLILLLSFGMQTFNKVFIVADYYINTSSFAINCINKATPVKECNGKCQMMKEIKKEAEKDQQYPDRRGDNKHETVLSYRSYFATITPHQQAAEKKYYFCFNEGKSIEFHRNIFHPPIA